MAFLLDTNIISELRKKGRCDKNVAAWQRGLASDDCYISVISLMEIRSGLISTQRKDPGFHALLADWYENQLKPGFAGRILEVDLTISERCAKLLAKRTRDVADGLIAATAFVHGLTLATRNTADFGDTGVPLFNPWLVLPE